MTFTRSLCQQPAGSTTTYFPYDYIELMFITMRTNLKKTQAFSKLYLYFLVILEIQIQFYLIEGK